MKPECQEFLEEKKLKELVKRHSEFISFPIELFTEKTTEKEVTDDEAEEEKPEEKEEEKKEDDLEIKEEKEKKEKKTKKVKEVSHEFERVNNT